MRKDLIAYKAVRDGTHGVTCPYCGGYMTTLRGRQRLGPGSLRHQARSCDNCGMGFINVFKGGRVVKVIGGRTL